ncbi:hypothetical protein EJ05DRAFT_495590 [Pseudovirgaria hyperparasitica]|uniref:Heat shock factor binding protein 1 n=1 Tax=Pseudovirgaria hyperparasitica TaxID=470096 RepID=A0A6A6WKN0_9PEZI|nr:uncharacterized protein EJ05DRAFT_495590 [Pseudovirgaria hyperparasitica]KAF2762726.1 hypothetical protein EJ05DRAFT_495590 [Pseudovirgaria hyperparasitica]
MVDKDEPHTFQVDDSLSRMNENATTELSQAVEEMLNSITTKFSVVSAELLEKMDEMSRRLDNLETTIQASARSPAKGESSKSGA